MANTPLQQYLNLMATIRIRLDVIALMKKSSMDRFAKAETCAFHGRKIIEGIAFGCLVAVENGLKHIPHDARGQWNAEKIFKKLQRKKLKPFPSPSEIRYANEAEKAQYPKIKATIEGIPERRIRRNKLIAIYSSLHKWLHETNPYVDKGRKAFLDKHELQLWNDLERVELFIKNHTISMSGEMFYATLRDSQDGHTKVVPLSKIASLVPSRE